MELSSGPGRLHVKGSEQVDRSAGNLVPGFLVHRKGFTRHYGLVDGSVAGKNHSVRRNRLSGQHAEDVPRTYLFRRNDLLPEAVHFPGGSRGQMNQLFNSRPGFGHGQVLKQRAELHDERNFRRGKVLPDDDGSDQRDGNEHIRLDVPGRRQSKHGFQHDGNAAQHNGYPRDAKGKRFNIKHAQQQSESGNGQQRDIAPCPSPFQQFFQSFQHMMLLSIPMQVRVLYTYRGIGLSR